MPPITADSTKSTVPAVTATNTGGGDGIYATGWRGVVGVSPKFQGVCGTSVDNAGVVGESDHLHGVFGICHNPNGAGCYGSNDKGGFGLQGVSATGDGVTGTGRRGVVGISPTYQGVFGKSTENAGVVGESDLLHGIFGVCHNPNGAGVFGTNDAGGFGLQGVSQNGPGVNGHSVNNYGVSADSQSFAGVRGTSISAAGTEGWSTSGSGIAGISQSGVGVYGKGGNLAALFDGPIQVNGDIRLSNGDCAEEFDILDYDSVSPGMVMVLSDSGALRACSRAYDKRAAGVVSGAGDFHPALILDRKERRHRMAVGLVGKVSCRVDANYAPIEVGDLLTTSDTFGYAMKAVDPLKAFGAVIGKALRALPSGEGIIPILIALQ